MKISTFAWVMGLSLTAFALYLVKYSVQDVAQEVQQLQADLDDERDALKMLQAEWAYLNRAERLRSLSDKYLELVSMSGEKIVVLDVVPHNTADSRRYAQEDMYPRFIVPTGGRY